MRSIILCLCVLLAGCASENIEFVATDLQKPKLPLACDLAPEKLKPYPKTDRSMNRLAQNYLTLRMLYKAQARRYAECQAFVRDALGKQSN